jgi:quinol monooxygenase YgiN
MAVSVGLLVTLEAKSGREDEVAKFLNDGLAMVQQEPDTLDWYAIRLSQTTFGIFDAFPHEAGRQAHLSGKVAAALGDIASELLASPPDIKPVDVLASKVTS